MGHDSTLHCDRWGPAFQGNALLCLLDEVISMQGGGIIFLWNVGNHQHDYNMMAFDRKAHIGTSKVYGLEVRRTAA